MNQWPALRVCVVLLIAGCSLLRIPPAGAQVPPLDDHLGGLIATYRGTAADGSPTEFRRIDHAPLLDWSPSATLASAHPSADAVEWTGTILIRDDGPFVFHADLTGNVELEI
ncbi:MAG: hypothetical protein KDA85_08610, partial [Planctomycetaceae bacterium]|nr:hypothetical protein [Planctomycetaceae bacterium]